jgi:hypothetical protein
LHKINRFRAKEIQNLSGFVGTERNVCKYCKKRFIFSTSVYGCGPNVATYLLLSSKHTEPFQYLSWACTKSPPLSVGLTELSNEFGSPTVSQENASLPSNTYIPFRTPCILYQHDIMPITHLFSFPTIYHSRPVFSLALTNTDSETLSSKKAVFIEIC